MRERNTHLEHDQVDLLLPWFVNKTLQEDESERVRRHVEACATCQKNLVVLEKMQSATRWDAAVPMVPSPRSDDLMAALAPEPATLPRPDWRPKVALAASIAALAVAVVVLLDYVGNGPEPEARFETATSDSATAFMDYVIAVEFEAGTTAEQRRQAFEMFEAAEFVAGEIPDTYRVTVRLPAVSLEELERLTDEMESRANIRSVEVVALQLPMR